LDLDRSIAEELDAHPVCLPLEMLVEHVQEHLPDEALEPSSVVQVADVHAWSLAHGFRRGEHHNLRRFDHL
jgi:hypothetical protein